MGKQRAVANCHRVGIRHVLALTAALLFWATPAVAQILFSIEQFEIIGENPLSAFDTDATLAPFLGPQDGLSGVEDAAAALEEAIKADGNYFHRVIVPPQQAVAGVFRLEVLSFGLSSISVEGNEHFDEANILRSLPALDQDSAPNSLAVARALQLSNRHPSRRVAVFMREAEAGSGLAADVRVRDSRPYSVFGSIDNMGDEQSGVSRVSVGLQHTNLFNRDHGLTVSYTTSPESTGGVQQMGAFYRAPLYRLSGELAAYYTESDVDTGRVGDAFDVSGAGRFVGLSYKHILKPLGNYNHVAGISVDDRLFENNTLFGGQPIGFDVRSRPLTFEYSGTIESGLERRNFYFQYALNLGSGNHNTERAYVANRFGADPTWYTFRFGGDIRHPLPYGLSLRGQLRVQYSPDLLISGEQFGVGGMHSVRGFEQRELTGDKGMEALVEVYTPPLKYNVQLLAFLDAGAVDVGSDDDTGVNGEVVASFGLGLRWYWLNHVGVTFDAAYVFEGNSTQFAAENTRANTLDFHGSLFVRY